MFYIQLIGLLAFLVLVLSFYKKETDKILTYQVTSNFAYTIHYLLLGALSGAFCSLISMIRNLVYIKLKKYKMIIGILFIIAYLTICILFYEDIFSLLPFLANSSYLMTIIFNKKKILLIGAIISSICWIIYSIHVLSYVSIITESILILSNIIQLIKLRKVK